MKPDVKRRNTRSISVGGVAIGGMAPVAVQSMTSTRTQDANATLEQIRRLAEAGCELVRVTVPSADAIEGFTKIVSLSPIPVIADIHFDYRLALASIEAGAAKIRINPGNIGDEDKVAAIIERAKAARIPIRIGLNSGSLPMESGESGRPVDSRLVDSALKSIAFFESLKFYDMVISVKASSVTETISAYRALGSRIDYPLHLGVTEAGTKLRAAIKSAVAFGVLLDEGIGDTIRVSVTGDPVDEVAIAWQILRSLDIRSYGPDIVSCPTCGRCQIDLADLARNVEEIAGEVKMPITIAVMGCAVNGPGEAKAADIGIAGGKGRGSVFVGGEVVANVAEKDLLAVFQEELEKLTLKRRSIE